VGQVLDQHAQVRVGFQGIDDMGLIRPDGFLHYRPAKMPHVPFIFVCHDLHDS
jgi:hypothetical protein